MSNIIDTTTDIQFYSDGKPEVYTNVENKLLCIEQAENLLLNCVQIDWQEAHLSHINDLLQSELGDSAPDNFNINTTEELLWIIDKLVAKAYGSVEKTANPTITATEQAFKYTITATGAGTVLMYIGDSTTPVNNPYEVQRGETDQTIVFKATAQEENKLISDTVTKSVTVKKLTTATPTITVTEGNTEYTIKATGNGTVTLYKGSVAAGNIVANPFVVQRTTVDQTITFKATAKEQGKAISAAASKQVIIPALPQEQTTYYWYAGWTIPTAENIATLINEEYPTYNTDPTLHKAGGSSTTNTGYSLSNPFGGMNNENRYHAESKVVYYVVVPTGMSLHDPEDGSSIMAAFTQYGTFENHIIYAYNGTSRNIDNIYIY